MMMYDDYDNNSYDDDDDQDDNNINVYGMIMAIMVYAF